jgi:alpha-1,3-rhamnosyl/mannosyltransferase
MALARADRLIVPSKTSALELSGALGIPPARIAIVPEAAGDRFRAAPSDLDRHLRAQLGLPSRYLLHSGGADPRKRLPAVVAAFDAVAQEHPDLGLVFVGPVQQGVAYGDLQRAIAAAHARGRIVVLGLIEERSVAAVYRGAEALVLATSHEGFGLPVIEAFTAGVPVVATAAPAIAELASDAARLVPVSEPELLRDALRELLGDASLSADLCARGRRRAAQFGWPLAAEETLAVYAQVMNE